MAKTTHTLIHLGEHVRKFGPLWTASCFPFESFYHYTVKLIHGTWYALHQVSQFPSPLLERTLLISHISCFSCDTPRTPSARLKSSQGSIFRSTRKST